jgi:hypothetical protein
MGGRAAAPESKGVPESRAKRILLASAVGIVALNVWTGSPLVALWVGSQVQAGGPPSMTALFVVVVVFAVLSFLLYRLLKVLARAYGRASGATEPGRRQTSWLKPMSGERAEHQAAAAGLTAVERILAGVVILVFVIFEVWFFFFSGSPYNYGSPTRSSHPPPFAQAVSATEQTAVSELSAPPISPLPR